MRFLKVRPLKPLLLLPFSTLIVLPAPAQLLPRPSVPSTVAPMSFDDIFASLSAPLSYKASDLKGEWRLVTIKARPDLDNGPIVPMNQASNEAMLTSERLREVVGAASGQYVTQGQTVAAGGELFLVTYKMKFDENELQSALEAQARKNNKTLPLPPLELAAWMENYVRARPLELRLLNVKMLGEISDIRAFDAESQAQALRDLMRLVGADVADVSTVAPIGSGATAPVVVPAPPLGSALGNTVGNAQSGLLGSATNAVITPTPAAPAYTAPITNSVTTPVTIPPAIPLTKPVKPAPATTVVKPLPPATIKTTNGKSLAERNAESQKNLHLIGLALIAYAQDHNGTLPPAQTPAIARKVLTFYAGSDKIWVRPDNGQAYLPNPKMSGRKTAHISNLDEWVAFYEANPAADGTRGVVFLDGKVARIPAADWPRAKKASKLP